MTFIQARHYRRGRIAPVRVLVVHSMDAAEDRTTAESVARWFSQTERLVSAHWCLDADSEVQCVDLGDTAYAAPGANADGIQYECAGYARQTRAEWLDPYSRATIERTAARMAKDAKTYGIPARQLSDEQLANGLSKGVVTHAQVSRVFRRSSHTDPGSGFPMDVLLDAMSRHLTGLSPLIVVKPPTFTVTLRVGLVNSDPVRTWQRQMRNRGWRIVVDGTYGARSAEICRAFQRQKGLKVDGVVGPTTWEATWKARVT